MKRKSALILAISIVSIVGFIIFLLRKNTGEEISIKTIYMMYACGDCYPQYQVKDVTPVKGYEFLLDQDISIIYPSKEQEDRIKKLTQKCIICYEFYFKGTVKFSEKKGYIFKATSAKVQLWDDKCCD